MKRKAGIDWVGGEAIRELTGEPPPVFVDCLVDTWNVPVRTIEIRHISPRFPCTPECEREES
ncbi:hypothetical protein BJF84_24040 [Rhodococcus sp. CUA-806]|nr:hypothetical protein BJF84_24040 [Rhodococcus sp. CUA-806]